MVTMGFLKMIAVAVILTAAGGPLGGQTLTIYTEESRPVNFTENGVLQGSSVEIVREVQKLVGDTSTIQVVPWARG